MSDLIPIAYGLLSALTWGAGDFSGGFASKRSNIYGVVVVSQFVGAILMLAVALFIGEIVPPLEGLLWGGLAGILGVVGLLALYRGLSTGRMGIVAPVSAVIAASVPVMVGAATEGIPSIVKLIGFALALVAIWLVTQAQTGSITRRELLLPVLAGLGFGSFFIVINRATDVSQVILMPLVAARVASLTLLISLILVSRQKWRPTQKDLLPIGAAGILDAGGNAFFALAAATGRLDVAAVLSSLYPAVTVLLARIILTEYLGRPQWIGLGLVLISIIFITV